MRKTVSTGWRKARGCTRESAVVSEQRRERSRCRSYACTREILAALTVDRAAAPTITGCGRPRRSSQTACLACLCRPGSPGKFCTSGCRSRRPTATTGRCCAWPRYSRKPPGSPISVLSFSRSPRAERLKRRKRTPTFYYPNHSRQLCLRRERLHPGCASMLVKKLKRMSNISASGATNRSSSVQYAWALVEAIARGVTLRGSATTSSATSSMSVQRLG